MPSRTVTQARQNLGHWLARSVAESAHGLTAARQVVDEALAQLLAEGKLAGRASGRTRPQDRGPG